MGSTGRPERSPLRLVPHWAWLCLHWVAARWFLIPLTDAARLAEADGDRAEMFGDQEPLLHPLTLHEALARALRYNLDGRVKLIEEALSQDDSI